MVELFGRAFRLGPAIIGSLAGTVLFGMVMQMTGMMPMIASLVGSESVAVGWLVHLVIGATFGVAFAAFAEYVPLAAWLNGLVYGVVVWIFGPLIVMPLWLGMPDMVFNLATQQTWMSLMGHLFYGLVTGLVYGWLGLKSVTAKTTSTTPTA